MSKYGIGQPVLRFEDPRLLRGQGRYINDVNLPGQAYAVFVRSPHAHANIRSIDVEAAKAAPGVLAVYTGHDVVADGLGMPKANMPRKRPDGKPMYAPQRPPLITDRVRYVGDPVAMVIAETLAQAKDAAELVEIDYEPLPSVTLDRGHGEARRAARCGTTAPTTSPTSSSAATRPPPTRRSRAPPRSSSGAT